MLQKGLLFCVALPALASMAMARLDTELFLWTFYFLPFFAFVLEGLGWLGARFSRREKIFLYGMGVAYGVLSMILFGIFLIPEILSSHLGANVIVGLAAPVLGCLLGNLAGIYRL